MLSLLKLNYECPSCHLEDQVNIGKFKWKCGVCRTKVRLQSTRLFWRSNLLMLVFMLIVPSETSFVALGYTLALLTIFIIIIYRLRKGEKVILDTE